MDSIELSGASNLIVGCGKVGEKLALRLLACGQRVRALVRSAQRAAELEAMGIAAVLADLDDPASLVGVAEAPARIFYLAPPASSGSSDLRVLNFCRVALGDTSVKGLVYLSTTGVYGDCRGAWIDETAMMNPQNERSRRRQSAEEQFSLWAQQSATALTVLRVAGIYGPGRFPLARLRDGMSVPPDQESSFVNLIHEEDLVTACLAAMDQAGAFSVVHACDGHPLPMSRYFYEIARQFALPLPIVESMAVLEKKLSPEMLSYFRESKRLRNDRLGELLKNGLRYPDLNSGLQGCSGPEKSLSP